MATRLLSALGIAIVAIVLRRSVFVVDQGDVALLDRAFGLFGGLVVLLALGCVGSWCATSLRVGTVPAARPCALAVTASLIAAAVHGAVDFVWYLPSHALLLAVLAGWLK